jgi:uncharacterized pyridoxal phosphate-containing UPF0001 family protein
MTAVDTMAGRLAQIQQRIADACARAGRPPGSVTLLPVSKTFGIEAIREAMALGLTRFGENKTQEIRQKAAALAGQGLQWVLIGHLQTNKARDAARDAAEVQSLDRVELAEALHRRLVGEGRSLIRSSWYICAVPGVAIMLAVLSLNLVGDGLNDALNPKLQKR